MIQGMYWISMWAITGGAPFMWTMSISVAGYRSVLAEASLSKLVLPSGSGHAKAAVWAANYPVYGGGTYYSVNWGIDGSPLRYIPNCSYMFFALEVNGQYTYAWMTGKLFVF
jgi:hypothetical protein